VTPTATVTGTPTPTATSICGGCLEECSDYCNIPGNKERCSAAGCACSPCAG
jgi:hypothetical protein